MLGHLPKNHSSYEEKLEFSELRYRRLFETAQDGILILNAVTSKIVDVNPFLEKLLGYSKKELLEKELWEIGVFKDIADSKKAFLKLQTARYIRYKDLPLQTKSGKVINVEFVSNVYMVGHEKVIQCNIRDISDRKKVEETVRHKTQNLEKLNKSQEEAKQAMLNVMEDLEAAKKSIEIAKAKDEAVLASIGDGLVGIDKDRKIIIVNKAAENMLGWKEKDMIGKGIANLLLEDEEGNLLAPEKRPSYITLSTGKASSSNSYFIKKGKSRFPIAITVTPIMLGKKIIGALDVFRDITHEKEIDRAKSEFVSLASHQLRTPLGITKWYLEALENESYFKKAPEAIQEYFDEIYKSNERVLGLMRDLLSVSRIEQGRIKDSPKLLDAVKTTREIVKQMQILALKKKIALHLAIHNHKIPFVYIDALRFREVLENLIGNAIEYSANESSVNVNIDKVDDALLLKVEDTGIGMSGDDQKKLFTKFFRSEDAVKYNPEGSGLGLYVVKSYVDDWGGKMSIKSVKGKGSSFTVTLPISHKEIRHLADERG